MRTLAVVLVAVTMLFSSVASLLVNTPEKAFADDPVVTFPDPGLEATIRDAIPKPSGDILQSDLDGLISLTAYARGIVDLTGIEHCTNLQHLFLQYNNTLSNISSLSSLSNLIELTLDPGPSNISALSGLTSLQKLYLCSNIIDISPLSGLYNLQDLAISYGNISDISPLSNLSSLQTLYLQDNPITIIPPLSGLTSLQTLYLDDNQIIDISGLSGLTSLQTLYLQDNQISVIPPLSSLTSLQTLSLYLNPISDISGLAGLTNLSTFVIGGPYVKGANISDLSALSSCINLEYLNLAGCGVSNISPLSTLMNLKELCLEYNWLISDVSPLSGLISLERLDLYGNCITDLSLSDLPNLQSLNLHENQISHISELSGLPSLQYLYLSGNQLIDMSWLSDITSLYYLELSNNYISDISGLSVFTIWGHLGLDNNQITNISALSSLSIIPGSDPSIGLSYNNISDIKSLVDNANISTSDWVYLSCNPLSPVSIGTYIPALQDRGVGVLFTELPSVPSLLTPENESTVVILTPTLTWGYQEDASSFNLQVSTSESFSTITVDEAGLPSWYQYNSSYTISSGLTASTTYYWRVDAVNCGGHSGWSETWNFSTFEDEVVTFPDSGLEGAIRDAIPKPSGDILQSDLNGLWELSADNRGISDLTGLDHCTSLTRLDLHDNLVVDISSITGLTELTDLELENNQIVNISALAGLVNLTDLEIDNNLISDLSPLTGLTNLQWFDLESNQITDISDLSGLTNLQWLYLGDNQIYNISALSDLTNLQMLGLSKNNISDISSLSALTSLGCLTLWENNISEISALSGLINLQTLDLASNQISNISTLAGLTNLQILQLGDNTISDLSALADLTYIQELKLYSNNISDIQPLVDNTGLDSGDYVDLRNNPLNATSIDTYIPALEGRGVNIDYDALPPANDDFADAQVLSGDTGTVIDNNMAATKEAGEPDHAGNSGGASVWYRWQAPCDGSASFDTFGSDFDTLLAVYTGSSVDALTEIASNDDDDDCACFQSAVTFDAISGTTYWIAVDGYSGAEGEIYLNYEIVCETPPGGLITYDLTTGLTPEQLAQSLVGEGISISNVQYTGTDVATGTFSGGTGIIGFEAGIILSTGDIANVVGPNILDGITTDNCMAGDPDLDALIPSYVTHDACILEFDFVPVSNVITIEYVFGSEEYNEWVFSVFNDVFGFFVNGVNCALIPGTTKPIVSVNNVNGGEPYDGSGAVNPEFYRNNDLDDGGGSINTELDGLTTVLTLIADVNPGETNHIKLAIADAGDHVLDSDVFIKASSLIAYNLTLTPINANVEIAEIHDLIATATLAGVPQAGVSVDFNIVAGPDAGSSGTVMTNASGQAAWSYTVSGSAANTIVATAVIDAVPSTSNYAYKIYDACPEDPDKVDPGACGCGVADTDSDSDGTPDCNDICPLDPDKVDPGTCGCGVADTDTDSDGTPDCFDLCPNDPDKVEPGVCGCGIAEGDCTPTPISYDFVQDWSADSNPNGAWSYGWMSDLAETFNIYDLHEAIGCGMSPLWHSSSFVSTEPCIWENTGGWCDGVNTGEVSLHPGPDVELSVARWTSPVAGTANITGYFGAGDSNTTSYYINKDGNESLFQRIYASGTETFELTQEVAAGSTIDFLVGGVYAGGNTPLDATIALTPAPSEVWVDDDFNASTPGWGYNHFARIQDGIDAVSGSTVHVAAGIYRENIVLVDGVELRGEGSASTTIDGMQKGSVITALYVGNTTIFDGFTVTNGSADYGGGMYNEGSSPIITNCTFINNSVPHGGGGMCNSDASSPTITNCIFINNSADSGGGMFNSGASSPTITNCRFQNNLAAGGYGLGGGMFNHYSSSPTITNCAFQNNLATHGGGMSNHGSSSPTITNCILWDDSPDEIYNDTATPIVTYSDVQGGYAGTGNINIDPLFVDAANGDLHLSSISPCIDKGNNSAIPGWLTIDFEGDARMIDGDGDGNATVDMGVDESLFVDSDSDGVADCVDGCPNDPDKVDPGTCGCGVPDTDTDSDGTPDCFDLCPDDPDKVDPGACGCGVPDTDTDSDGTPDCNDLCPDDPDKTDPGACGCGVPEGECAPANDDFADAQVLSGDTGTVIDNNAGATKESGEPNHVGNSGGSSVWYQWQSPCDGNASFDTFGSDFDTLLAVYTGSSVDALTEITSNDDDPDCACAQSSVEFTAVSGTTYWIAVDGYNFGGGASLGEIYLNYEIVCETPTPTPTPTPGPPDTAVSVSPLSQDVNLEQTFDVAIAVDPTVAIAGVQFNLNFDASLLQANSVTEGDLLNQGGCSTVFNPGTIDNDAGTITSVYGVINTPGCGVSDAGTFATISFTARDVQGISALNMSNVVVGDPDSNPVSFTLTNGSVHISKRGDLTGDNRVNVLDMIRIGQHWGQTGTPGWIPEDIKPDGVINVLDMIIIGQNWTG